jgi:Immunoglobulin domain
MKNSINRHLIVSALALGSLFGAAFSTFAQITVKVDSTKNWLGYMNQYDTNGTYITGGSIGTADLRAGFIPAKVGATRALLQINTSTYNTNGPGNLPDGTPNRLLEANFYVDVGTTFGGNDVTFEGMVESNSIPDGWICVAIIKQFASGYAYIGDTRDTLIGGSPFSVTRSIAPGNICQYGFLIYGPNTAPGSTDALTAASVFVDNADPAITANPVNQRVIVGGTATFQVTATGASAISYQWHRYGTNLLNGGKISGATSATLTISDCQAADATSYYVTVSDTAGLLDSDLAELRVLTPDEFANLLDNPGFELDVTDPTQLPEPWLNFTGSALVNTNDYYGFDPSYPVQTHDGTNAAQVTNIGEYNGFYQDVPALPGQIFAGGGWFYMSSVSQLQGTCEAFLEVQFRQGSANPIAIYQSSKVDPSSPTDTWFYFQATNGVPAGYSSITTSNADYLVAPAGTEFVRYQLTLHNIAFGGNGYVYLDSTSLTLKTPVLVKASLINGDINLSWLSQAATSYQVVYKDNLTDGAWTPTGGLIPGNGSFVSVSYPVTEGKRFYGVLTE